MCLCPISGGGWDTKLHLQLLLLASIFSFCTILEFGSLRCHNWSKSKAAVLESSTGTMRPVKQNVKLKKKSSSASHWVIFTVKIKVKMYLSSLLTFRYISPEILHAPTTAAEWSAQWLQHYASTLSQECDAKAGGAPHHPGAEKVSCSKHKWEPDNHSKTLQTSRRCGQKLDV